MSDAAPKGYLTFVIEGSTCRVHSHDPIDEDVVRLINEGGSIFEVRDRLRAAGYVCNVMTWIGETNC